MLTDSEGGFGAACRHSGPIRRAPLSLCSGAIFILTEASRSTVRGQLNRL